MVLFYCICVCGSSQAMVPLRRPDNNFPITSFLLLPIGTTLCTVYLIISTYHCLILVLPKCTHLITLLVSCSPLNIFVINNSPSLISTAHMCISVRPSTGAQATTLNNVREFPPFLHSIQMNRIAFILIKLASVTEVHLNSAFYA